MTTEQLHEVISPIVAETYGDNGMSRAMVYDLAQKIEDYDPSLAPEDSGRERMIMLTAWNWFSGGDTAASFARRVEEAIS